MISLITDNLYPLALFGSIGAVFGLPVAWFARRTRFPFSWTLLGGEVVASIGGSLVVGGIAGVEGVIDQTYSLHRACAVGLGTGIILFVTSPFTFGVTGTAAGCALQWVLQRCRRDQVEPTYRWDE